MAPQDSVSKRKLLDKQFSQIFTKFTIKDFEKHILSLFEDITIHTIESAIVKFNYSKKMTDIAKILLAYTTKEYSYDELQSLYYDLLTLNLVLYNTRKVWTAVLMKQGTNSENLDDNCIDDINQEFRREGYTVRMNVKLKDDILWMVLVLMKRTKSNGYKYQKPCYIACHTTRPYIFYSPKSFNQSILKIFIAGLGYRDHKVCKLSGHKVTSLVTLLQKSKRALKHRAETSIVLKNTVADCVRLDGGLDFCQEKVRSAHADQILGEEKIELEKLTINANTEWRGLRSLPEAEGTQVTMTLQIKSKNVRQTIQEMIKAGILNPPYPEWVKEFLISGKNVINIA